MSLTDPINLVYIDRHDYYLLMRGRETFYTDDNYMRTFLTPEDAIMWCEEILGVTPENVKDDKPRG